VREINTTSSLPELPSETFCREALALLRELTGVLGIMSREEKKGMDEEVAALIEKRQAARAARDFKTADAIRDELKARHIVLEDTPRASNGNTKAEMRPADGTEIIF
jgi:cysteinyl-tRNA synthetase